MGHFWGKCFVAFYWLFCLTLTHLPPSEIPTVGIPGVDKIVHLFIYFGLSFFFSRAFLWPKEKKVTALLGLLLVAALDELSQPPFGRTAEILDWCSDSVGILLGLWLSLKPTKKGKETQTI